MQFNSVYLYPNKIDVFTNAAASWTSERYRRVYNRNLKIYRGVDNRVDIQVRNPDEKATDISGSVMVFNLFSTDSKDLVLQKDCAVVDATKGKVYVTLTAQEMLSIESGYYNFSIVLETREDIDGSNYRVLSKAPMYSDSQYGVVSQLEVHGDIQGNTYDSLVVKDFSYTNPIPLGYTTPPYYVSSIIPANPNLETPQSLHTFAFYFTGFNGKVTIQGSLEESSTPAAGKWVDIPDSAIYPGTNMFNPEGTAVVYKNVTGKWRWFRIYKTDHKGAAGVFTIQQTVLEDYIVNVDNGGSNYVIGETVFISGRQLGGVDGINDLLITVTSVNGTGAITGITWHGTSIVGYKTWVIDAWKNPRDNGTLDKVLYR